MVSRATEGVIEGATLSTISRIMMMILTDIISIYIFRSSLIL